MDVDATTVVATVCLAATTIAVFGLLSYCSSAVITMTVAVAMVSWVATTTAAVIGLSGLSCSPASVAITTAAETTMDVAAVN